jgi:hypothetical protein
MFFGYIFCGAVEFGLAAAGNGDCIGGDYYSCGRVIHWFSGV